MIPATRQRGDPGVSALFLFLAPGVFEGLDSDMIDRVALDSCEQRFAQEASILGVWLLGSAASGRLREDSDVDFAVLYRENSHFAFEEHGRLASDLEAILGRPVDLGRLTTRNLIYAYEAIRQGKLVYELGPGEANDFAERVAALYFDLKRDRKVVEDVYCAG